MTITFRVAADHWREVEGEPELQVSNANGCTILNVLGLPVEPDGETSASDLAAKIRRHLWPENSKRLAAHSELPATSEGNTHYFGRRADYLEDRFTRLLRVAERAIELQGPKAQVSWY